MELYILDSLYRRIKVIDKFESLIWTERWQALGDFELKIKSTLDARGTFLPDTFLAMSDSDRVMQVKELEDVSDDEGQMLHVTGVSAEKILQDRMIKESLSSSGPWYLTTSPIGVPRQLFDHVFGNPDNPSAPVPQIHGADAVPLLSQRFPMQEDFAVEEGVYGMIDWVLEQPDILYNQIRKACYNWDLGFRIVRDPVNPQLYFEVYTGRDLTTRQTTHDPVIFSVDTETLRSTKEFTSVQEYKNVVYVVADGIYEVVGRPGTGAATGFDRKIITIVTEIPADWSAPPGEYLTQVARDALAQQAARGVSIFEGELNQNNEYEYGEDYLLGDIVELRNRDGVIAYKHVTEQIFVSDQNGERAYPTLSVGRFNPEDTWQSFGNSDLTWEDYELSADTWSTY